MFSLTPKQSICRADLPIAILAVVLTLAISAHAQTYLVLHKFGGGADGWAPYAGLTMDRAGNFYGTTWVGGQSNQDCDWGCGVVFKLTRTQSNWTLDPIYTFQGPGAGDGSEPVARVTFGPDGALYGTTSYGGASNLGTVFRLTPGATACKTALCPWSENLLYSFQGGNIDGAMPGYGDVIFDAAGRLYGTTMLGGGQCYVDCGTVYQLARSGGGWSESVIYFFASAPISEPNAGVILDNSGNLYGTAMGVGDAGAVYELTPAQGGWSETTLFDFNNRPEYAPIGGLLLDSAGNLYGTTAYGGFGHGGTVFELSPSGALNLLFGFSYAGRDLPPGPTSTLTMDASGALYGTTYSAGMFGCGSVFKLTPSGSGWTYRTLHDFTCDADGGHPWGQVILDADGNVYGSATIGGTIGGSCPDNLGCGVVFEITP